MTGEVTPGGMRLVFGILSVEDLAIALDVTAETLETWRGKGRGPRFAKLGRAVFYRIDDVTAWISDQVVDPAWEDKSGPQILGAVPNTGVPTPTA